MKYCPYCGAGLPDGTVLFCPECGKSLPDEKKKSELPDAKKHKPEKKLRSKKRARKHSEPVLDTSSDETQAADDYDGYYDDILPVDEGRQREGIDRSIVKKIAALVGGLVVVIGICIALMYLL